MSLRTMPVTVLETFLEAMFWRRLMKRSLIAVLAAVGLLGYVQLLPGGTAAALANSVGIGGFGHVSPAMMGAPATPFVEPRYELGPGNIAPEASPDSCLQICMTKAAHNGRGVRHSCRKSCASTEY